MTSGMRPARPSSSQEDKPMEITARGLWTLIHGMGFGGLYLMACSGALVELWRRYSPSRTGTRPRHGMKPSSASILRSWPCLPGSPSSPAHTSSIPGIAPSRRRERSTSAASRRGFSCPVLHHRLALPRHGVERACRVARAHLHHHGGCRFYQVRPKPQEPSAASYRSPLLHPGIVSCRGHRRLLWRHA